MIPKAMSDLSKATMQGRATSKQRSVLPSAGHQRSLSAPKPMTSRRKSPHPNNSRPSPNISPSVSRPASRSSNDQNESVTISQPKSDKAKRRTRNGRRNASDSDQQNRSSSDREDLLTPTDQNASPTKPSRRSKRARPQSQLAMQLPSPVPSPDPLADEAFPSTLLSKSAPTASFLSRKNAKGQPSTTSRTACNNKPDWDMPVMSQRPVQDSLTWQQTLLGGSRAVDDSTVSSKSAVQQQDPSPALTFQKQKPPAANQPKANGNLTWQQIALGETNTRPASTGRGSPTKGSSRNVPRRGRSRNEGSGSDSSPLPTMSSLSLNKPIAVDDVFTSTRSFSTSPQKPPMQKKTQSSPAMTGMGAVMVNGELKYAGPDFHNSPKPSDLPAPARMAKRVLA